jgi:hypothetical protein
MTRGKDSHESEVAAGLVCASLLVSKLKILGLSGDELLLAFPLQRLSPGLVAEPVANVISITSVNEDWDFGEDLWDKTVEWLHPVALEEEVAVNVKVAGIIRRNLNSKGIHDVLLVQVLGDVSKAGIAEVGRVFTLSTDIVDVLSSALIRTNHGIVAVDAGWDAGPDGLRLVAVLNKREAARKSVIHSLAFTIIKNSRPATFTTGHWSVSWVLSKAIGESIADEDRLQVDIALLVGEDLRGENWNIVASVGLSSDMEVLSCILGELLEEESEKSIDILSCCNGVADRAATVGETNVDWLVKKDDRCVVVPGIWVVVKLQLAVDS